VFSRCAARVNRAGCVHDSNSCFRTTNYTRSQQPLPRGVRPRPGRVHLWLHHALHRRGATGPPITPGRGPRRSSESGGSSTGVQSARRGKGSRGAASPYCLQRAEVRRSQWRSDHDP
jgi:hypothetical protein